VSTPAPGAPQDPERPTARRLLLIVNPSAGGGRTTRTLPAVEAALAGWGADVRIERTRDIDHAEALVAESVADARVPVAFGGDGLAGRVAGAAADAGILAAVLPGGRGNDFLRALGASRDPAQAAAALATATERRLDLGMANGRAFLGIASLGFDSDVQVLANRTRLPLGSQVYTYAALRTLSSWQHARFSVEVDGEARSVTGWSVAAANSPYYGGGMRYAPDASLDDGMLDVVLAAATSRRRFLQMLPRVFSGRHVDDPHVEVLKAQRITVDADRPFPVYADGDPVAVLPVTLTVRPGALRLLVEDAST